MDENTPKEMSEEEVRHFKLLSFMNRYKGYAEPVVDRTSLKYPKPPKKKHNHKALYRRMRKEKLKKLKSL